MNIFNKITLENMKKSKTRTLVTIIGVILSAAMITGVFTFAVSLQNYMINGAKVKYGNWHVEVLDADYNFTKEVVENESVLNAVSFENIGYAEVDNIKSKDKPYLFIAGFTDEAFDTLPLTLVSGRMPKNNSEVLIPSHLAVKGGIRFSLGDTLKLSVGNRINEGKKLTQNNSYNSNEYLVASYAKTYTVVGICERPGFEESSSAGYTLITKCEIADKDSNFSTFITLKNPREIHDYIGNTNTYSYILNDNVLRFMGLSDNNIFNGIVYSIGIVLIILIMTGSVFLIYNSFNISLNERMQQFGILSSIGATPKQLRNCVLFEGLYIGIAGIPIGIILGIISINIVISIVSKNFASFLYNNVPLTLKISLPAIVAAIAVSLITILISAYIPAKKSSNASIIDSIRQTCNIKIDYKTVRTSKLTQRLYGLEGTLALKNFKRNKKRYFSIVLSLTLSVVLFVSASAFGIYLKKAADQSVIDNDYDICFSAYDMDEAEMFNLYEKLKNVDEIYESSYQALMKYSCSTYSNYLSESFKKNYSYNEADENINIPMDIQFIEDREFIKFIESLNLNVSEYTGQNAKMIAVAKSKNKNELPDIFINKSMNLNIAPENTNNYKNINVTFVDTVPLDTLPQNHSEVKNYVFMIVAPYELRSKFEDNNMHINSGFTFKSKDPFKSVSQMNNIIQSFGVTCDYNLYNIYDIVIQNRNILFVVNIFTYVFVIMISLIAIANVINTISTNIKLRKRELAMLLSIGMTNKDFKKMMNFECAFYGMKTLLFGILLSIVFSYLIYKGLVIGGAEIKFSLPWLSIIISIISIFFIVFITMIYAVNKIEKENIIDAIRDDIS